MRAHVATLLIAVALVAFAVPALGQAEEFEPAVTVLPDEEFCDLVSDDPPTCEAVLTGLARARVLPQAYALFLGIVTPEPSPEPSAGTSGPGPADDAKVGDSQARENLELTLLKADWRPDLSDSFFKPAQGNKYVSVLVRYEALDDGANFNIIHWNAFDRDGTEYDASVLGQIKPDLKVGQLAAGEKVQGWVTFEVPDDVSQLEILETQPLLTDLSWTIERQPR